MTQLKQEFLRKITTAQTGFELGIPLFGEFYIDLSASDSSWISPEFLQHLGYDKSEAETLDFRTLLHPDDAEKLRNTLNDTLKGQSSTFAFDLKLKSKQGEWNRAYMRSNVLRRDKNKLPEIVHGAIILTDEFTEMGRVEAENKRLSQLQALLMKISATFINLPVHGLDDAISNTLSEIARNVKCDRIYVFEYVWDKQIMNNTHEWCGEGIEPQIDELQGLDLNLNPEWPKAHQRGQEIYIPDVSLLPEGVTRDVLTAQDIKSLFTIPMVNDGVCTGFVGFDSVQHASSFPPEERKLLMLFADMLVNVQMRTKAQREIDETKAQLESILLEMNDVIWSLSMPDLKTVIISPSIEKLTGAKAEECAKSPFWWEGFIHPDDKHITAEMMHDLNEKGSYGNQHRIIDRSGKLKWVRTRGRVIYNIDNEAVRIDSVISDITEQKISEERVKNLLDLANEQNDRFKNFAHIVTHNLRSNASNIVMLHQFWKEETDPAQLEIFAQNLEKAVASLNQTITDLNEVVELTTTTDAALRPVALSEVIATTLPSLEGTQRMVNAKIDVEIEQDCAVLAVPAYLTSVLHNLLSNSLKYRHPEREPHIRLRAEPAGDFCALTITDNGQGIDLQKHGHKLFGFLKTFHKHPEARGLGLFITKNQVISMGGRIEVESVPNEGTVFKVYLKMA